MKNPPVRLIVTRVPFHNFIGWAEPLYYFDLLECGHGRTVHHADASRKRAGCHDCKQILEGQPCGSAYYLRLAVQFPAEFGAQPLPPKKPAASVRPRSVVRRKAA